MKNRNLIIGAEITQSKQNYVIAIHICAVRLPVAEYEVDCIGAMYAEIDVIQ